jgi:hypothetical protein
MVEPTNQYAITLALRYLNEGVGRTLNLTKEARAKLATEVILNVLTDLELHDIVAEYRKTIFLCENSDPLPNRTTGQYYHG